MDEYRKGQISQLVQLREKISESIKSGAADKKKEETEDREEQFRKFFNKMPDAVIILGRDGTLLEASEMAEKMTGYRKSELLGKNILTGMGILDARTKMLCLKKLALQFSGAHISPYEIEIETKHGKSVPLEINSQLIDYMGKKAAIVSLRDITERKNMEEELKQSEERYRFLVDNSKELFIILSKTGKILFANKSTLSCAGYSEVELTGKPISQFLTKDSVKKTMYALAQEFLRKPQPEMEVQIRTKLGKIRQLEISEGSVPAHEEGKLIGVLISARDITERRKAEKTKEEYKTIISTSIDGFWIVDMEGYFIDVNDAYCRLMGYSRDEMLKMKISDIEAKEKPEETAKRIRKIVKAGGDRFETQHKRKDGRIVNLEVSANYAKELGERMFVFLRDITERKKAEEELEKVNQELKSKMEELERFNKLSVGRELKMIELKKRIEELEGNAGKQVKGGMTDVSK